MKGYRTFILIIAALLILYGVAELNKPKHFDWSITLSRADKNPYGAYIVYNQLKNIFPEAVIQSNARSINSQIKNVPDTRSAYLIVCPAFTPPSTTTAALKRFVAQGNYVFASANWFYTPFLDSLGAETSSTVSLSSRDSTSTGFVNPVLKNKHRYTFNRDALSQYFTKIDTGRTVVLSTIENGKPIFIKIPYGKGAFFIHTAPLCFSNYFLLAANSSTYASTALSYLPKNVSRVYWDESEKQLAEKPSTPLRFFLSDEYLRWAIRLSTIGIILYVLFEMKRRQRVIPVIEPLKNNTVHFVKTVAGVYFSQRNNKEIASQKIAYFLEFLRNRFNISTSEMNEEFVIQMQRKTGVDKEQLNHLTEYIIMVSQSKTVADETLLKLERNIDNFYKKV